MDNYKLLFLEIANNIQNLKNEDLKINFVVENGYANISILVHFFPDLKSEKLEIF
jgi:hypothetical protein